MIGTPSVLRKKSPRSVDESDGGEASKTRRIGGESRTQLIYEGSEDISFLPALERPAMIQPATPALL